MMYTKAIYLISAFVLIYSCTSHADVVIGDFEGDLGTWISFPDSGAVLELGTVGTTSGNSSLNLTVIGGYWELQWILPEGLVLDLNNVTTLELDAAMLVDNFAEGTWTKIDKLAINSDLGWREVDVTTVIDKGTGEEIASKDWGTWSGDSNRTITWDIGAVGYDWTGLTDSSYVTFSIAAMGAGVFHIDNIRLNGVDIPGWPTPEQAKKPSPAHRANDIPRSVTLSWKPGIAAQTHNLFFGSDLNDVNNATLAEHSGVIVVEGLDVNNYEIDNLDFETIYYWRVDEVTGGTSGSIYKGILWSFTSEPYSYKIPGENITASAGSSYPGNDPNNTINESGLNPENMDLHSQITSDMWLGTGIDGNNVWIRYDFNKLYKLHEMLVWNYNGAIFSDAGFKEVKIEYSDDGQTWETLPDVPEFAQAPGVEGYEYNTVVDFNEVSAQSVRLTVLSNWSGSDQFLSGLSEVRFMYIPVRAREPEPEAGTADVAVDAALSWRAGRDAAEHNVYISTNEQMVIDGNAPSQTVVESSYLAALMLGQTYYWRVDEVNNNETPDVWPGDIWNFSTREYVSIEDFEDYNDSQSYEIWNTWTDGYGIDENGSQMGHNPPPYSESAIVQNGKKSAPLYYDNTTADYSEVTRTFDVAQNLGANGADTLKLHYRGNTVTFYEAADGSIAMSGEGTDIWGNADQFRFAYKQLTGSGSIIARVDGIQNTNATAKAGVMIRSTLNANSSNAFLLLNASGTVSFQRRTTNGGSTTQTTVSGLQAPYWVKITRNGNSFTAQRSADGITWINVGSAVTISMGSTVYAGLAVTSHTANVLAAAAFSGIQTSDSITGDWAIAAIGDTEQAEGDNTPDVLFITLEDNNGRQSKVFASGSAVGTGVWTEWAIPYGNFTNIDITKIKRIKIGIGDSSDTLKGKGLVYIDNMCRGHALVQ
ncbi:MAG: discoidin domain-containing protein [Sedimentisphaerales bacterium]|nr:discoidin domain-containing protein [Sedimentisphaerales bacterium]